MSIRLLLIEDNPDHLYLTKRILEGSKEDYNIDLSSEPNDGLKKIFEQDYDLVLCDYRLPGTSALEILKLMKEKGRDFPLIVVTASGNERAAVELMKEGAYDYILKDISYEETLPLVIKRSIERYAANKEKEGLEAKIKEAAGEWETTFNSITDLISIHGRDFRIVRVNKAFASMFKMNAQDIIGRPCYEIFHVGKQSPDGCPHKRAVETREAVRVEFFEDKFQIYFEISVSPIFNEQGEVTATVHIAKDITARKKAEQQLRAAYQQLKETQQQLIQSSKMAAMGQLAAGISHELNQPLTGIKGFAQAVLMDLGEESPLIGDIEKIIQQSDRIDNIIKNVRIFARKSDFTMKKININQPIEDSLMLLSEQLRVHNITVNKSLSPDLPKIQGDPNQLQQAFLNIITNARDAIESSKNPEAGEIAIKSYLCQDNSNIEIIFQDNGCGIHKEQLGNLFNPFFTTKGPDRGMGLGLAICYRIIESHKGRIEVESQVGKGSTFKIILPLNSQDSE